MEQTLEALVDRARQGKIQKTVFDSAKDELRKRAIGQSEDIRPIMEHNSVAGLGEIFYVASPCYEACA